MLASARRFYWQHVRRYRYEICQECGRPVGLVWWCFDSALWEKVTGFKKPPGDNAPGILCIPCFDRLARDHCYWIEWAPLNLRHLGEGLRG